jgi:hypothetical protein
MVVQVDQGQNGILLIGQVVEEAVAVLVLPASLLVTVEQEASMVLAVVEAQKMGTQLLLVPAATARRE